MFETSTRLAHGRAIGFLENYKRDTRVQDASSMRSSVNRANFASASGTLI